MDLGGAIQNERKDRARVEFRASASSMMPKNLKWLENVQ